MGIFSCFGGPQRSDPTTKYKHKQSSSTHGAPSASQGAFKDARAARTSSPGKSETRERLVTHLSAPLGSDTTPFAANAPSYISDRGRTLSSPKGSDMKALSALAVKRSGSGHPAGDASPRKQRADNNGDSSYAANATSANGAANRGPPKADGGDNSGASPNLHHHTSSSRSLHHHTSSSRSLHHQTSGQQQQRLGHSSSRGELHQQPHHSLSASGHGQAAGAIAAAGAGAGGMDATAAVLLATGRVNMAAAHMEKLRRHPSAASDSEGHHSEHHGHHAKHGYHSSHHGQHHDNGRNHSPDPELLELHSKHGHHHSRRSMEGQATHGHGHGHGHSQSHDNGHGHEDHFSKHGHRDGHSEHDGRHGHQARSMERHNSLGYSHGHGHGRSHSPHHGFDGHHDQQSQGKHSPHDGHHERHAHHERHGHHGHHDRHGHHHEDESESDRHSHHRRTPGGGRQRRMSVEDAQLRGKADSVLAKVRNAKSGLVI
eukprot:XP_001701942.1 ZIP family transporter [Chlamydomonas reinhardtii]